MMVMSFALRDSATAHYNRKQKWVFYSALVFRCMFWPLAVLRFAIDAVIDKFGKKAVA